MLYIPSCLHIESEQWVPTFRSISDNSTEKTGADWWVCVWTRSSSQTSRATELDDAWCCMMAGEPQDRKARYFAKFTPPRDIRRERDGSSKELGLQHPKGVHFDLGAPSSWRYQ